MYIAGTSSVTQKRDTHSSEANMTDTTAKQVGMTDAEYEALEITQVTIDGKDNTEILMVLLHTPSPSIMAKLLGKNIMILCYSYHNLQDGIKSSIRANIVGQKEHDLRAAAASITGGPAKDADQRLQALGSTVTQTYSVRTAAEKDLIEPIAAAICNGVHQLFGHQLRLTYVRIETAKDEDGAYTDKKTGWIKLVLQGKKGSKMITEDTLACHLRSSTTTGP
jgi:hypothetical protein